MTKDTKNVTDDAMRWLRVGALTLTTLAPIINSIAAQLRQRAQVASEEAKKRGSVALADNQEKLLAVSAALTDALTTLKDHPYSQEVVKRGGDLTDTLVEQSNRLSQILAERGGDLLERGSKSTKGLTERGSDVVGNLTDRSSKTAQALLERSSDVVSDLADRSSKVTQVIAERGSDLTDRSSKVSKQVVARSQRVAKQITQRSREATSSVSERPGFFWSAFGFSLGLSAALAALYILLRRRTQEESVESQSFQLSQNGHLNGSAKPLPTSVQVNASVSYPGAQSQAAQPSVAVVEPNAAPVSAESSMPSSALQQTPVVAQPEESAEETPAPVQVERPLDATFLGIVRTKRYYPVETKLDQLEAPAGQALDIVYFTTEEEAQEQGYSKAE